MRRRRSGRPASRTRRGGAWPWSRRWRGAGAPAASQAVARPSGSRCRARPRMRMGSGRRGSGPAETLACARDSYCIGHLGHLVLIGRVAAENPCLVGSVGPLRPWQPPSSPKETLLVVRVQRSARRSPRILTVLLAMVLTLPLVLVWAGGAARAAPSAGDLQRQLRRLNGEADQAVERYLNAKLGLDQTRASLGGMQRQVGVARKQLDGLRVLVSARAAEAYMFGPAAVALMLNPSNVDDKLDRMQTLNLLAQQASDQLDDLITAERAFETELARLRNVEQQREQQVKRLAAEKDKVEQLLLRTQNLLGE